jgi:hypothetical protein
VAAHHSVAVTAGTPISGEPAVVALVARRNRCTQTALDLICSGVLIGPRVVLTAAHCLEEMGATAGYEVVFGNDLAASTLTFVVVQSALKHPGYNPADRTHDAALLLLAEPADIAPVTLPAAKLTDAVVQKTARVVGFGRTAAQTSSGGIKRQGLMNVDTIDGSTLALTPNPGLPCTGDDGGPVYVQAQDGEVFAGIVSGLDPECETGASVTRVDALLETFIEPVLSEAAHAPPGWPPDAISLRGLCKRNCSAEQKCPAALSCLPQGENGNQCTLYGLAPGEFTATCSRDDQCPGDLICARLWPHSIDACRCYVPCDFATLESDAGISNDGTVDGDATLDPSPSGNGLGPCRCTIARPRGGPSPSRAPWLILLFVLVLFHRTGCKIGSGTGRRSAKNARQ